MTAKKLKVLIVDREPYWLDFSKGVLRRKGYRVVTASSHDELVTALQAGKPDLLLLGFAAIGDAERKLIGDVLQTTGDPHVLVLSTSLPLETVRDLFVLGASDVTNKPFAERELLRLIENHLQQQEIASSYREMKERGLNSG
jgi:DNA-binding response OmpR family regulator